MLSDTAVNQDPLQNEAYEWAIAVTLECSKQCIRHLGEKHFSHLLHFIILKREALAQKILKYLLFDIFTEIFRAILNFRPKCYLFYYWVLSSTEVYKSISNICDFWLMKDGRTFDGQICNKTALIKKIFNPR